MELNELIAEVEVIKSETRTDRQLIVKEGDLFGLLKYYDERLKALDNIQKELARLAGLEK